MSVFRSELNWSTYQDKQLRVLQSIEGSINSSLNISRSLEGSIGNIERALSSLARASEATAENVYHITQDLTGSAREFHVSMDRASTSTNNFSRNVNSAGDRLEDFEEDVERSGGSLKKASDILINAFSKAADKANDFSKVSNDMIKMSGMSGQEVRKFRSEVLDIVRDLNTQTGSAFSPMKSYESLMTWTSGVTSNLEAIQEMARPLLLSSEALDVSMDSVATLFNRFYTRYTFSSENMEDALNSIRGNTAGNSANAEATLKNLDSLKVLIDNAAGDDNELREELLKRVSNYTSWIESMDMDSDKFTEFLKNAAYGDFSDTGLNTLIGYSDMSHDEVARMAREGEYDAFTQAMMDGVYNMLNQFESDGKKGLSSDELGPMAKTFEALGHDVEFLLDTYNARISGAYEGLNDFLITQAATPDMEELVEDKFYTMSEKANNWLENIYAVLARIQEHLPIGFSDIVLALTTYKAFTGGGGIGQFLRGGSGAMSSASLGGGGGATGMLPTASTSAFGSSSPLLGKLGGGLATGAGGTTAAGLGVAGGALAGVAIGVDGLNDAFNEENGTGYRVASGAQAALGLGGAGALVALGASNPIGWAAIIGAGVVMVGKEVVKLATTVGEVDAIEKAYEDAAAAISTKSKKNEEALLEIKSGLEHDKDLDDMRRELVNSGILSEADRLKAAEAAAEGNREALIALTDAYLEASGKFTPEMENDLQDYARSDAEYAEELKKSFLSTLKSWGSSGRLADGSDELAAVDRMFYSIYGGLQDQASNGVEFDKATQKVYDNLTEFFAASGDGGVNLTNSELAKLQELGILNTVLQNSNLGVENIVSAAQNMAAYNDAGQEFYNSIMPQGKQWYGTAEATHVLELANKALYATNKESAQEYLDKLKAEGHTSSKYKEIGEAATKWGLTGYAEGTNYILKDQLALLHEGEAVVPKKYNPTANLTELEMLREQSKISQQEMSEEARKSQEYMRQSAETLKEIKEFLSFWRDDSIKRESTRETKNRYFTNSNFLSSYMMGSV